jgi:hypothetical protein
MPLPKGFFELFETSTASGACYGAFSLSMFVKFSMFIKSFLMD